VYEGIAALQFNDKPARISLEPCTRETRSEAERARAMSGRRWWSMLRSTHSSTRRWP